MRRQPRVTDVIGHVYDAVLEPTAWQSALGLLCEAVNAKSAALQTFNPLDYALNRSIEYGTDPVWSELLHTTYADLCPIGPIVMLAEVCEPASIFNYIDEQEFLETRFYREWCVPQDYYDMCGALIAKQPHEIGTLGVMGQHRLGRFGPAQLAFIGEIAPHVKRAVQISGLLEHRGAERASFAQIVEHLATAVIIVDRTGRMIGPNAAARELLARGDLLRVRSGSLVANGDAATAGLRSAFAAAGTVPALVTLAVNSGVRRVAAIMRVDDAAEQLAVFVHAPSDDAPASGRHLVATFGFTPRELAVLMPLMQGKDVTEVAASLGVSLATTRTHLRHLFEKTGTSRQADLIRVVAQAMPPVRM